MITKSGSVGPFTFDLQHPSTLADFAALGWDEAKVCLTLSNHERYTTYNTRLRAFRDANVPTPDAPEKERPPTYLEKESRQLQFVRENPCAIRDAASIGTRASTSGYTAEWLRIATAIVAKKVPVGMKKKDADAIRAEYLASKGIPLEAEAIARRMYADDLQTRAEAKRARASTTAKFE